MACEKGFQGLEIVSWLPLAFETYNGGYFKSKQTKFYSFAAVLCDTHWLFTDWS